MAIKTETRDVLLVVIEQRLTATTPYSKTVINKIIEFAGVRSELITSVSLRYNLNPLDVIRFIKEFQAK